MNDELKPGEPHPAAQSALRYVIQRIQDPSLLEALASCAIESNRMAEICLGTINRIKEAKPVSDRYLLGLAWFLKEMEESKTEKFPISRFKDGKWEFIKWVTGTYEKALDEAIILQKENPDYQYRIWEES